MNILKKIRTLFAVIFFALISLLFLDFTGSVHAWFGWLAKIQFIPAIMALNVGVIIFLVLLTLLFGRLYCSVICPLGVFQDVVSRINRKKNHFSYSPALKWLRYTVLVLFILAFIAGIGSFVALLEPYSSFGRIMSNMFAPFYQLINNFFAYIAERADSYTFYNTDIWIKSIPTFIIAVITFIVISILAFRGGRTYCNTVCPVGTVLGFISKFSFYKIHIDDDKCNSCGLCARNCKSSCIDSKQHKIDYSRCVACYDCIGKCKKGAIVYKPGYGKNKKVAEIKEIAVDKDVDQSRRSMLTIVGAVAATSVIKAQETKMDGGLAFIEDKKIPKRQTPIVPPGSASLRNFTKHCTACQLCVSVCPNGVLRPSTDLLTLMQPEVSYERGYCRPECTSCSDVCPAGAILPITKEDKSATQIGHAVGIDKNCVVITDEVECGNCARHCPVGAITMIDQDPDALDSRKIPMVNVERCIGCGACENLCPSRPFSAIYVEGNNMHRIV